MTTQNKNNQNYARADRGVKFPSERGVPERRGVYQNVEKIRKKIMSQ